MRKRILIIDDEPDAVAFLTAFLEDSGYDVHGVTDAGEGLALVRRAPPDLLLLDLQMPGPTGVRVYRDIRSDETLRSLPVVFVTGVADFDLFDGRCQPMTPPDAILEKPVDRAALLATVRRILG